LTRYLERCGERLRSRPTAIAATPADAGQLEQPWARSRDRRPKSSPASARCCGDKDVYIDAVIAPRAARPDGFARRSAWSEGHPRGHRDDLANSAWPDRWFSERSLTDDGAIERARTVASQRRRLREGRRSVARATDFGDEKDRVVCARTVSRRISPDIAYHLEKRSEAARRSTLGADHHGASRVRAGRRDGRAW
jgi:hypothetical protein